MELTPDQLREYLHVLKAEGVEECHLGELHVRFGAGVASASIPVPATRQGPGTPKSMWENPLLWPGGNPPKFPTDK